MEDKRITLEEAAKKIHDGAHLFWGGFGYQRPPAEFARQLIRQKKRDLTLYLSLIHISEPTRPY